MIRYAIRRFLWGLLTLFVLLLATFVIFGPVLQGQKGVSAANTICGDKCSPERVHDITIFLGLDRPWYAQFGTYVERLVLGPSADEMARMCPQNNKATTDCVGRLGQSFKDQRSVDVVIGETFPTTLSLAIVSVIVWLVVSFAAGILSALRRGSLFDRMTMVVVLWGQALPIYYFGLLALWLLAFLPNSAQFESWFGFRVELFPIGNYEPLELSNPWPWFWHLILPAGTLALQFAALYTRMIRSGMLTALGEDYVRTARAKGVSPRRVVLRHAARNVLLPIVTMTGLDFGTLLGGAVLTETTFGLPGLGRQAIIAVGNLDVPMTSGIVLFAGAAIILANIVVDLLYATLDPRIRLG